MKELCADALMWSCLGSGVISLWDLESEIYAKRIWDSKDNCDKDFIAECQSAGIEVFSVIFTAQGYEIGITTDKNETKIVSFGRYNKKRKFWGLQEFYSEKYPKLFKGWRNYFDDFFYNKKGKKIKNFLEETTCRNIHNKISHCFWTQEVKKYYDLEVYLMCKNSPYWMMYLKKLVEVHIDAGVSGILFDETASPYEGGILAGFCKHCTKKFSDYLVEKYGKRYRNFNYRKFLRKKLYGFGAQFKNFRDIPFGNDFVEFQLQAVRNNFKELVDFTKNYAKKKNKEIKIAGNFGELLPYHFHLSDMVDVFNLELMFKIPPKDINTAYLKLARYLAGEKPTTLVPSIFNASYMRNKKVVNLEKYYIAEASSHLVNYQIPYSCFTIEGRGSYYPNVEEIKIYQNFLKTYKELYNGKPLLDVYLIFSYPAYLNTFSWINYPGEYMKLFYEVEKKLTQLHILSQVVVFGDGKYLNEIPDMQDNKLLILTDSKYLVQSQVDFLKKHKYLVVKDLNDISNLSSQILKTNLPQDAIITAYQDKNFITIHIVNCQYREDNDEFKPLKDITIEIAGFSIKNVSLYSPDGKFNFHFDERCIELDEVKIYSILRITI